MANRARNVDDFFFPLIGGLDLVTPAIGKDAGFLIAGANYEPHPKGYQRVDGFERFDGRPKPSEASYWVLNFDAGTATIAEGATVTGATSGATGKALIAMVVSSGSFGASNAAGYLVLTAVSGTFQDNENLQVTGVTKCVANGTATEDGASNDTDDATWTQDAIETARTAILAAGGSGPIRGGFVLGSVNYCFRDNVGATAGQLLKQSTSGWTVQSLGSRVTFQTGTGEITAGQTVTGASSGASAVVTRVALRTGTWAAGTAQGQLIFASITSGPFTNGENLQVGGLTKAVANGNSAAITLPAAGTYRAVVHNFFASSGTTRAYFTSVTGTAFEWDGTVCVPIVTGMTTDTPRYIAEHKMHLFLGFPKGSAQHSSPGEPYNWSPIVGAGELGIGEEITGFAPDIGGTMAILGRNKNSVLYGNGVSDWALETISKSAGAIENTVQQIGRPIYLDDAGLRTLETTDTFGDFRLGTITDRVEPLFRLKKKTGVTAINSLRVRAKNQYRLFWSDGTGLTVYLGRKKPEIAIFDLGVTPTAVWSGEDSNGNDLLFCGDGDGKVYQLDAGTSFDGEEVRAYIRLAFTHCGRPQTNKVWRRALVEIDCGPSTAIGMSAEFDYGDPNKSPMLEQEFSVQAGGGFWDDAVWDLFNWDTAIEGKARLALDGKSANISIVVASESTYAEPHIIHGMTLFYSPRGMAK